MHRAQSWYRLQKLRGSYLRLKRAALVIEEKVFHRCLTGKLLRTWITAMSGAANRGDLVAMRQLLFCEGKWARLEPLRSERVPSYGGGPLVTVAGLVNLRVPFYFTSFLHHAAKSGSLKAVRLLLAEGGEVEASAAL